MRSWTRLGVCWRVARCWWLERPAAVQVRWPSAPCIGIGMGRGFRGVYNLYTDTIHVYIQGKGHTLMDDIQIKGLDSPEAYEALGDYAEDVLEELELVKGATHQFEKEEFLAGRLAPVFFGTAMGNFGVREMLDNFVRLAPPPQPRATKERIRIKNRTVRNWS